MRLGRAHPFLVVGLIVISTIQNVEASGKKYHRGDIVPLYANKVGPYGNPSEQYEYYTLPFCAPKEEERKPHHLGEILVGDRMMKTLFALPFLISFERRTLCSYTLKTKEMDMFQRAIDEDYYFEMFYDDIPVQGFIGEKTTEVVNGRNVTLYSLFTNYIFTIGHNGEEVLEIQWDHDPSSNLDISDTTDPTDVHFTYSVKWLKSQHASRDHVLDHKESPHQHLEIRWFSIFNSIVTVLLLTGFLATILMRILKNDFTRYARMEEESGLEQEETGWKLVNGDVFRFPDNKELFCAILGNGMQLMCMCFGVLFLACIGPYTRYNRGALLVASLLIFAFTSGVNGYVAASMYTKMEGKSWVWALMLAYFLFLGPFFVMGTFLNFVAVAYNSSAALPFGTVVVILLILTLVSFPLNVVGGISGRNFTTPFEAPCRTNKLPREIPPLPAHRQWHIQIVMAGFLPFSAIYIELYYVFASVWGHQLYSLYGILLLVFLIVITVTAFITIALAYFQLTIEDYRWWWSSILNGGSTALFVFGYCFYYFKFKARMTGFMQTSFFFGYMSVFCYGTFLVLAAVGFFAAQSFIRYIYSSIKCD